MSKTKRAVRKKIVVKHEGRVVEEFQARGFDFEAVPAYVVTGRRVQVPSAQIEDRLYVNGRIGGQVVAIVPSKLDQCWNLYFDPTEGFQRSLRRSHRRVRRAKAEEAKIRAGKEAGEVPLPQGSNKKPAAEMTDPGAGAVLEGEAAGDGDHR